MSQHQIKRAYQFQRTDSQYGLHVQRRAQECQGRIAG